jgi:hypothetical protein
MIFAAVYGPHIAQRQSATHAATLSDKELQVSTVASSEE